MTAKRRRTGIRDGLQRELHWEVIAVLANGSSPGRCEHHHATRDEATRCTWAPPEYETEDVCDLLVRELRTERPEQVRTKARR